LDIEEDQVWRLLFDGGQSFPAVGAFAHDLNVRLGSQELAQALASERLVIDD
jgi:hypothetical protein